MSEFRIATWNTQGNAWAEGKLASLVNSCSPDVICLQECGNLFSTFRGDLQRVRSSLYYKIHSFGSRAPYYHVYYYSWRNSSRCSMATLINSQHNVVKASLIYSGYSNYYADQSWLPKNIYDFFSEEGFDAPSYDKTGRRGLRGMLQTIVDLKGYDGEYLSINNVHLPSGRPNFAIDIAKSFFRKSRHFHSDTILIGDMNIPVNMWKQQRVPYRLFSSDTATHSKGQVLDYLFTNLDAPVSIETGRELQGSDHFHVLYKF